jgi:hypothetical protein
LPPLTDVSASRGRNKKEKNQEKVTKEKIRILETRLAFQEYECNACV